MEQKVRIVKCDPDGTAQVVHIRESACSGDCHKCSGCGAVKQTVYLTAQNPIRAQVGDVVYIQSESAPVLAAAAILYLLPIVLFLAGYLIGHLLWQKGIWLAIAGFLLAVTAAVGYDRVILKKKKTVYTIMGYAQ